MSELETRTRPCPSCGAPIECAVAGSVDIARAPDRRDAILRGHFQVVACAACGQQVVFDDPFIYTDFERKQWIGVYPLAWETKWRRLENAPHAAFTANLAALNRVLPVRPTFRDLRIRTVFGFAALREKLICSERSLEDVVVEALKLDMMRDIERLRLHPRGRPRLVDANDGELVFVASVPGDESAEPKWSTEQVTLPRSSYDNLLQNPAEYAEVIAQFLNVSYVDTGRVMLQGV